MSIVSNTQFSFGLSRSVFSNTLCSTIVFREFSLTNVSMIGNKNVSPIHAMCIQTLTVRDSNIIYNDFHSYFLEMRDGFSNEIRSCLFFCNVGMKLVIDSCACVVGTLLPTAWIVIDNFVFKNNNAQSLIFLKFPDTLFGVCRQSSFGLPSKFHFVFVNRVCHVSQFN